MNWTWWKDRLEPQANLQSYFIHWWSQNTVHLFLWTSQNQQLKIDSSCTSLHMPSRNKIKRTLALTVSIWCQFPGTSRQEQQHLSTINTNTVKKEGTHSAKWNTCSLLWVCCIVCVVVECFCLFKCKNVYKTQLKRNTHRNNVS